MKLAALLACTFAVLSLAACGGGGSSTGGQTTPPATLLPAPGSPPAPSIQTSVPPPTYAPASIELAAFRVLNQERQRCGVGLLAQNAALDVAAVGQALYQVMRQLEGRFGGHDQVPGMAGYVAATAADRARLAGYPGTAVGEDLGYFRPDLPNDVTGEGLVRGLLATVYHQSSLMDGFRDVGLSVGVPDKAPPATRFPVIAMNLGYLDAVGKQDPNAVITYPCEGTSGIQPAMAGENPDPFAGLGFTANSGVGHPIMVRGATGSIVKLISANLAAGSRTVPVVLYHATDDKNGLLRPYQAFVIPRETLQAGATYQVNLAGTVNGEAFSRSFTFTTAATN